MTRGRIALYAALSILPLIVALWIAGVDPNYLLGNDVTSTSAYVNGELTLASSPVGGSVSRFLVCEATCCSGCNGTSAATAKKFASKNAAKKMPVDLITPPVD